MVLGKGFFLGFIPHFGVCLVLCVFVLLLLFGVFGGFFYIFSVMPVNIIYNLRLFFSLYLSASYMPIFFFHAM